MGKWINWAMWGITFPFLGAVLSAVLVFLDIYNKNLWQPQLSFLGINVDAFAVAGVISAVLSFVITITISIAFWLVAGAISLKTSPMVARSRFSGSVHLIFVPWLALSLFILVLNVLLALLKPDSFSALATVLVDFMISLVINYVFIWVSVTINVFLKMQRYLPA